MYFGKSKLRKASSSTEHRPLTPQEITEMAMLIKARYPSPIIGVIGSTDPDEEYHDEGVKLGQELASRLDRGTVMTGGVTGVGLDVYIGVLKEMAHGAIPSGFFILIPDKERMTVLGHERIYPFRPEPAYVALSKFTGKQLTIERVGESMADRRLGLAVIADIFVVMNGSEGTLEEAAYGLTMQKPVLALPSTGGAARLLCQFKEGIASHESLMSSLDKDLIFPMVESDLYDNLIQFIMQEA